MIPQYPNLKPLTIEDLPEIKEQLNDKSLSICEFAKANLIIWQNFDKPQITKINNNLCILISPPNEDPFFFQPLGNNKLIETLDICVKETSRVSRVSESFIKTLPHNKYKIKCLRDQFDYVYETKTLAEMKGRKFDGKRNHIKKFERACPTCHCQAITPDKKDQLLNLFETWFEDKKTIRFFPKFAHLSQRQALDNALKYFREPFKRLNTLCSFSVRPPQIPRDIPRSLKGWLHEKLC